MNLLHSWHKVDLLENISKADFLSIDILFEDFLTMDDSDDIIYVSLIYWIARVSFIGD